MKNMKLHHHLLLWGAVAVVGVIVYKKWEKSGTDTAKDAKTVTPPATTGTTTNFTGNVNMRP